MIQIYPAECLRKVSEPVTEFNYSLRQIVNNMKDDMGKYVGIAAPQIGINKNIIVLKFMKYIVMINPVVTLYGKNLYEFEEGCLSLPGEKVKIKRPDYVAVDYQDVNGSSKSIEFEYFFSQAYQHEQDHLLGKLIIDYKEQGND